MSCTGIYSLLFVCTILCTFMGHPRTVLAQAPESSRPVKVHSIEEVTVRSSRPVATAGGASAIEAEIDSLETPVAASVEEVLRQLPALHVRTNSRGEAELSARGSESRQVAVLLDGIPITLAWDARADVSVIPATGLQEVTYTRGLSSMLHGPNVLGGVVEASLTPRCGSTPTPGI